MNLKGLRAVVWADELTLPFWSLSARLLISVKKESNITITVGEEMSFMVLLHRVWKKHPVNVDFLGIYIPPENQFSPAAHGLIGKGWGLGSGNGGTRGRGFARS